MTARAPATESGDAVARSLLAVFPADIGLWRSHCGHSLGAPVNDLADFLHVLDLRSGRGRRRRGRRGRNEPCRQLSFRQRLSEYKGEQYQKTHQSS